jgi:hypothetical protein
MLEEIERITFGKTRTENRMSTVIASPLRNLSRKHTNNGEAIDFHKRFESSRFWEQPIVAVSM